MNFEFSDQNEINKKHKMIWVYSALFIELFDQASEYGCLIEFDQVQFYFKISAPYQELQLQMKQFLNTIQIVVYKTKSQIEAQAILRQINSDQLNQKLKTNLNCKIAKLVNFSKIDPDLFTEQSRNLLIEFFNQWKSDYLVLVYSDEENKGNVYYQQKFEEFLKQNIKSGQHTLEISRDKFIENANKIVSFTQEQTEMMIEIKEELQNCLLIFTFWYSENMDQEMQIVNKYKDYILNNILQKERKQKSIIIAPQQQNSFINQCSLEYQFQEFPQEALIYLNKYYNDKELIDLVIMGNQKCAKIHFKGSEREKLKQMVQQELSTLQSYPLEVQNKLPIGVDSLRKQIEYVLNQKVTQPKCAIIFEEQVQEIQLKFKIFCSGSPFQLKEQIQQYFDQLQIQRFPQNDNSLFQFYKVENAEQFCQKTLVCYNGYLVGNILQIKEIISHFPRIDSNVNLVQNQAVQRGINKQHINILGQISDFSLQSQEQSELKQFQQQFRQFDHQKKDEDQYSLQNNSEMNNQNLQGNIQPYQNVQKQCLKISVQSNKEKYLYIKESDLCSENCQLTVIFCKSFSNLLDFNDINDTCVQLIKKYGIDYEKCQQKQFKQSPYILTTVQDKFILALLNTDLYDSDEKKCFAQIESNIETIFKIAYQNKLQSFALPVFGCGPCDYSFHKVSKKIFNLLLKNLKLNDVENIILVEDYKERFDLLKRLAQTNVNQPKYLYSFSINGNQFNDEINIIINNAIEAHKNRVQISLSYFQNNPTHLINFEKQEIFEIKTNHSFKLSSKIQNNYLQYYINSEPSEQRFNSFLNLLSRFHINICKFYQNDIFLIIENDKYFLKIDNQTIQVQKQAHLDIESEIFEYKGEQIEIQNIVNKSQQKDKTSEKNLKVELPKNFSEKFLNGIWRNFLKTGNYKVIDQLTDIQFLTDLLVSKETDWKNVENTVDLESLSSDDKNYQQITRVLQNFQVIDVKQIKNQKLLQKYEIAQKQMIKSYQAIGTQLTEKQVQRMLWAVLANNPKVSYDKDSLGIEVYDGDWGKGAYFTEDFSDINYKRNVGEKDETFAALYCNVGIGKCFISEKNRELYRSLDGNDSVCNPDQTVFILYCECIARAYPSYEVTFKKKGNQV